ncbi:MAG: hypothetical protein QGG24_08825, partial [Vicinamibacterales bacterium]|nr:hypothetical protein [Vicinamibacterales bacterium]
RIYETDLSDAEVAAIYADDVSTPSAVITSPLVVTAAVGMTFTYQITADNSPTGFNLYNAPGWLDLNASSGILSGRADLIEAARMQAAPNDLIGRGMKVGKEEIIGFLVALDRYTALDHDRVRDEWSRKAQYIADELRGIRGLVVEPVMHPKGHPQVELQWDESDIRLTPADVREALKNGDPRVALTGRRISTRCLRDGEEILVARRVRQFFLDDARRLS